MAAFSLQDPSLYYSRERTIALLLPQTIRFADIECSHQLRSIRPQSYEGRFFTAFTTYCNLLHLLCDTQHSIVLQFVQILEPHFVKEFFSIYKFVNRLFVRIGEHRPLPQLSLMKILIHLD